MMVSEPFHVQILSQADAGVMRSMLGLFARAFEDSECYLRRQPSDAYLSGLLAKPHFIAIAVLCGGEVVGGLAAYQLDKFEQDRREIYIYDLAVDEANRRCGLATAMIRALQHEARSRDAYVIFVQADLVDAPAIALYDKLGVRETAHHFDIPPAQEGDVA